jgi:hypothetical protein
MVEMHWDDLRGREVRYGDGVWELTGDVDVLDEGAHLVLAATEVDDVRHPTAELHFGVESPPAALNPGDMGDQFDSLERSGGNQYLVIKREGRTYRYKLQRMESE